MMRTISTGRASNEADLLFENILKLQMKIERWEV